MSQRQSGFNRIVGDRYYTPAWVTDTLLREERFPGNDFLDPSAGAGHVVDAVRAHYGPDCHTHGFDISPDAPHIGGPIDFLSWDGEATNIITNPPYGAGGRLAVQFIEKALAVTRGRYGKVAMLLRVDFDSAKGRRHIFGEHPAFSGKLVLTKRIRWANIEQTTAGPSVNHAWFIWDWTHLPGFPRKYGYLSGTAADGVTP